MHAQVENGTQCPLTMTYAALPVLAPSPARNALAGAIVGSQNPRARLRSTRAAAGGQELGADRHGHDRASGWVRRARQYDSRKPGRRRRVPPHGSQVVFLGADVRCTPGARTSTRRAFVFPASPHSARWHTQHRAHQPPEGQAGQPIQRLVRGRIRCRVGVAARRRGTRRARDHRDGAAHAARLHHRQQRADARRGNAGAASRARIDTRSANGSRSSR